MAIANPTPIIGLERQVNGTNSNTWNDRYTANWLRLEDAVASSVSVNVAAGDVTLTTTDSGDTNHDAQNRYSVIIATGAPVAARNVIWSAALTSKRYLLVNSTGQNVTFKVTAQTGVTLAAGARIAAWCNGTDIVAESVGYSASLASVTTTGAATIGNGLTVTTGGATVSAGGINVTGNSTITGTLGGLTALTMGSGLITTSASGIKFSDNTTQTTAATTFTASGPLISSGYTQSTARLIGRTTAASGAPEEISVGAGLSLSAGTLATTGLASSGAVTASGLTQSTARMLGRTTAATGAIEEISIGTGLTLAAGSLSLTAPSGATLIASGSLSGVSQVFTSIPATYAYLVLQITGASSNTAVGAPSCLVQVSTNNGVSYNTTASAYSGSYLNGGTAAATTLASLGDSDPTINQTDTYDVTVVLHAYQGGMFPSYQTRARRNTNAAWISMGCYVGSTTAINALRIYLDGSATFDAGTYALYGVA